MGAFFSKSSSEETVTTVDVSRNKRRRVCTRKEFQVEVVENILIRLPVKQVLQCKSLSKTYYDLINKRSFVNKHLLHWSGLRKKIVAVVDNEDGSNYSLVSLLSPSLAKVYAPPQTMLPNIFTFLVGSSNGLLCAILGGLDVATNKRGSVDVASAFNNRRSIVVWNPATKEHMILSNLTKPGSYRHMGFGYDSTSEDYKVVMISLTTNRVHWWSMKENSWSETGTRSVLYGDTHHCTGVSVRQKLYWLASIKNRNHVTTTIMSFDLVNNNFHPETELPDALAGRDMYYMNILDLTDTLALSNCDNSCTPMFDIWVMNDSDNSWAKNMSIGPFPHCFSSIRMSVNGMFLMVSLDREFLLYDHESRKQGKLPSEVLIQRLHTYSPCSFCESLVSLRQTRNDPKREAEDKDAPTSTPPES